MYMGKSPSDGAQEVPDGKTGSELPFVLLGTIADTTWRMFVPSVGFTLLGVWLDGQLNAKPWLMFTGIVLGASGAWLLVRKQMADIRSRQ